MPNLITVTQNNNVYEVRYRYDPYFIELIKRVPGRSWDPDKKLWTIPLNHLGFLINTFKNTTLESLVSIYSEEQINVNASLDSTDSSLIPDIDISNVPFHVKEGYKPLKHQLEFMKYMIGNGTRGFILADEPGMTKTCQVINQALYRREHSGYKHCLIICCINTSKYIWRDEIEIHTHGKELGYILGTRIKRDGTLNYCGGPEKLQDLQSGKMYGKPEGLDLPYFIIVNVEALRARDKKYYPFTNEIIRWVNSHKLHMIVIDEVHKNLSPSSLQGKCVMQIKRKILPHVEWMPLTGTPMVNKPTDVFLPLKLVDGHDFKDYWSWSHAFCIYGGYLDRDIIGYKNIPILKNLLQTRMLRRLKKDQFDLPEKSQFIEYVENTPYQSKLYQIIKAELKSRKSEILGMPNPLLEFIKLRQVNGSPELIDKFCLVDSPSYLSKNAKLARLLEIVEAIESRGEKCVIYSNWVRPLSTIYKYLSKKYKVCQYHGELKEADRELEKKRFVEDPSYTIMLGTIGALGITHNLTVSTNVIFYDEPFTPDERIQAEDRCYCRGDVMEPINVYTLLAAGTIDERVHKIWHDKSLVSNYIVDNDITSIRNNPNLFEMLLM